MNSLQERKLNQYKEEISRLEKETSKMDFLYALRLAWVSVVSIFIVALLYQILVEKKSPEAAIRDYGLKELFGQLAFWIIIDYFFLVKGLKSLLKSRRREMEAYERKLAKEAAS